MTVGVGRVFFFVRVRPVNQITRPDQTNRATVASTMNVLVDIIRSIGLGAGLSKLGQSIQEGFVGLLRHGLIVQKAEVGRHSQFNPVLHHQVAS